MKVHIQINIIKFSRVKKYLFYYRNNIKNNKIITVKLLDHIFFTPLKFIEQASKLGTLLFSVLSGHYWGVCSMFSSWDVIAE